HRAIRQAGRPRECAGWSRLRLLLAGNLQHRGPSHCRLGKIRGTPGRCAARIETTMAIRSRLVAVMLTCAIGGPLSAQWFHYPTPGVPRTADGKPNLAAPAPRAPDGHPDLSGVWSPDTRPLQVIAPEASIPFQPWSQKLSRERADGSRG